MKKNIRILVIVLLGLIPLFSIGQVSIPREGFPYCEPFTGSAAGLRPETVLGGSPTPASVGNGYLTLTNNGFNQSGFVYIDIPFSADYGIKASFEYASYGGSNPGADGFSFFLFDGRYGELSNGALLPFQIGGFGGSLGYAQKTWPPGTESDGVTGAYLGIGFDEWGNFVRKFEKHPSGGASDNIDTPYGLGDNTGPTVRYPHTISIRGPEVFSAPLSVPYELVAYRDVDDASFPFPFDIDSSSGTSAPGFNCPDNGANPNYRKVFVELVPEGVGYRVFVKMRVGNHWSEPEIDIFPGGILYPYIPPDQIKIGFAAATGSNTNYHLIRNLAVDVSTFNNVNRPEVSDAEKRTCVDEEVTILIDDVILKEGATFIQCVQLYDPALLGTANPPWENITADVPHLECGIAEICGLCSTGNLEWTVPGLGVFNLEPLGDLEIDSDGNLVGEINDIEVTFTPEPGAVGVAEVLYTAQDNFGLVSEPGLIRVIINPIPEILDVEVENPTCDAQDDGSIRVEINNLLDGATYRWLLDGNPISPIAPIPGIVSGEAELFLPDVSLGSYRLEVFNPKNDGLGGVCPNLLDEIVISVEDGTPVELEPFDNEICEGTDAVITPTLDPQYNPNNLPVPFRWYSTADRSGGPLPTNGAAVVDGVNVTVNITAAGEITISGLVADGLNSRDYTLYVETDFQNNPGNVGNFCPFVGDVVSEAVITVFPALDIYDNVTADWCRASTGEIQIEALGGNGDKTFILFDDQNNELDTQVNPTTATFLGLLPGDYIVEIESSNPSCFGTRPLTVEGPVDELFINALDQIQSTCGLDNGTFTLEIGGGNGPLAIASLSISGGPNSGIAYDGTTDSFTYSGLAPGVSYTVTVTDARGCEETVSFTIVEVQTPVFSVSGPSEACEDHPSVDFTATYDFFEIQATAVPVFNWYTQQTGGTPISNGTGPGGMDFTVDNSSGNLQISNLEVGDYNFWLEMSGPDACNLPRVEVEFTVNAIPETDFTAGNVSCFGGNDGTLEVIGSPAGAGPFSYELIRTSNNSVAQTNGSGNFSGLIADEYLVRITNTATGCTFETLPYSLTEPVVLEAIDVIPTPTSCGVPNNGGIELTLTGGTAPYTFVSITRNGSAYSGHTITESGTTYTFTGLQVGDYEIVFRDAQNCTVSVTETVDVVPVPDISLSADPAYCYGETITITPSITEVGTLTAPVYTWVADGASLTAPNGNFGGGTYSVTSGTGINPPTLILNDIDAGDYTFTLEVRGDGSCELDFPVDLTVNPLPNTSFDVVDALCFGGFGSLNLASGGQAGNTYTLSTGQTNSTGVFTNLVAGDYTVTITNSFGCEQQLDYNISEPTALEINPIDSTDPFCGVDNGEIIFDVLGGTKDYSVTLNGTALNTTNFDFQVVGDTYTVGSLAPGFYSITVTDANACTIDAINLFELVNNDGYSISSSPLDEQICEGGVVELIPQLTIEAGADPILNWYFDSDTLQEITSSASPASDGNIYQIDANGTLSISNLPEGDYTYYLKITGDNICAVITTANVTVIAPIQATANATPVICFGESNGTIQVDQPIGGSGTYEFSLDGTTWQPNPLFENLASATYSVFVRDDSSLDGCTLEIPDVLVDSPPGPIEENQGVELPVSCGLDNGAVRDVLVTGGWGNYTFEWRKDDPVTGQLLTQGTITGIEDLASGTYFLIVTDAEGCIQIFDYEIIVASDPVYELVDPINSCFGEPIEIRPIHIAPDPSLPPSAPTEIRWYKDANQTGLITDGPDSSDPSVIYSIDDSDWLNPLLEIQNLPVGVHDFYFYVVCTGQEIKVDVTVFDTPAVVFETDPVTCFGDSDGKIRAVSGNNPEYTYSIDGAAPTSVSELEAQTFGAGIYQIEVITPAGCPQVIDVEVLGPSGPLEILVLSDLDPSCSLENGEVRLRLSGGNPDYTLTLNGVAVSGFDASLDGVEVIIENLPGGTHNFELTDSKNCTPALISITLDPLEVPVFDAIGAEICAFDPISGLENTGVLEPVVVNLAGSSPSYTWYYENSSGTEIQVNDGDQILGGSAQINSNGELELAGLEASDTPYKFLLEVTGPLVCPGPKIEVEFKVNFTPEVVLEKTDIACFGEATGEIRVQSGALPGYTYTLNTGQTNDSGTFTGLVAGSYSVEISNGSVCTQTLQIEITQPDQLELNDLDFTDPTCGDSNGEIVFELLGGEPTYDISINGTPLTPANFTFTDNSGIITIQNLAPGNYTVKGVDQNGCEIESIDLFTLTNNPGVNIDSQPIVEEICEDQTGELSPDLIIPGGVTPVLRWYKDDAATQQIVSSSTPDADGIIYQIDAQGILSVSNLTAGVYNYYLRISGPGICTQVTEATLTVVALPSVVIDDLDISCFGNDDGSISVSSGHDPSYTYTLSDGASNSTGDFTNLTPGSYTLEVENSSGCIQTIDFEIEEPADLAIDDIGFINPTCDENNGEITFEITGGTGDYTITINGQDLNASNFAFIVTGQEYTVKGLAPGAYSIEVTDENGCVESAADLFTLVNESGILIGSNPLFEEIMLDEVVILTPDLTVPGGVSFELNWYFDDQATEIITSSPSPAADGVIYQIDANGQFTLTELPPGTYKYYFEISGPGICVTITEATVVVKSPLTADIITSPVTCFGGSDGSISLENIEGGTPPLSFSLDGTTWQSSPVFQNLPVGTYSIYIKDPTIAVGFLTVFSDILIETTATEIVVNTPDIIRASCNQPNGAIQNLVISGGAGGYTFEWRKDDPISGELLPTGTLTGIEDLYPGDYFLTLADANGCQEVFSFEITEIPDPVYELVPPLDICLGDPVTILPVFIAPNPPEPTASTEIGWYKEAGQVGLIVSGPDSENANITYTVDNSDWLNPQLMVENLPAGNHDFYFYVVCTGQEIKVDVQVFETPDMVLETTPITCFGDIDGKILSVSGALPEYTYSLNGAPAITLAELESLNLGAGNYSVEILTPAGCEQVVDLVIDGPDSALSLDPLITIDPGCGADNGKIQGQITGGWAPYTVNLYKEGALLDSFVQTDSNLAIDDLSIGQYSLEVIDDKGCRIDTGNLDLVDGPTQILVDNQEICEGSEVVLTATLDPAVSVFTIQWFFDEAGNQPITSSPNPAPDGAVYQISSDGVLTISGLTASAVPYQYFASATGPDVCVGFVAKPIVRVNEIPLATSTIVPEQCFGEGGIITINATGGSGIYEYSIDGVNFQASNSFSVDQGTYAATVRTQEGCEVILPDLVVAGPPAPIAIQSMDQQDVTCGQQDGSISIVLDGGYGDYEVDLLLNSTLVATGTAAPDGSITFPDLGIGNYSFVVRDSGGCEIRFDNAVDLIEIPTPITVNDVGICEGEEATLTPSVAVNSPDVQFAWFFDAAGANPISSGTTGGQTYTLLSDGSLTVAGLTASSTPYAYYVLASGTDICGTTPEQALVSVTQIPNLRVSNPSIVCDPEGTVDLTQFIEGFNPAVYDYNVVSPTGSPMRLDELSSVDQSGDYRVSSAAKGTSCWNQPQRILVVISDTLLVAEFNYLVDFGNGNIFQNEEIPMGEDVYFNDISQGNSVIWNWDFGDGFTSTEQNPVHVFNEIGTFVVKLRVVDDIGCVSEFEKVVEVLDDYDVIIPNAFTPLGNKNQFFKPEHRGIASLEFFIFNTWGELIYTTTSLEDKGWDGILNGQEAPNGNYVYRGRFVSRGGVVIEKSGVFILIR